MLLSYYKSNADQCGISHIPTSKEAQNWWIELLYKQL